tara:strand:+ start:1756 stop:1971 length:216 start_codon:yes stop_codon:yes gene_type:complete
MANMSYCRYENTSKDLHDVVKALMHSDCDEDLSYYEVTGLKLILELSQQIVNMEDKIENIIENSESSIYDE